MVAPGGGGWALGVCGKYSQAGDRCVALLLAEEGPLQASRQVGIAPGGESSG